MFGCAFSGVIFMCFYTIDSILAEPRALMNFHDISGAHVQYVRRPSDGVGRAC